MSLLYGNLLKHAAVSVGMCCCVKLEGIYKRWAANDLNTVVIHLRCFLIFTWGGLLEFLHVAVRVVNSL
jgi:hypothetical protein